MPEHWSSETAMLLSQKAQYALRAILELSTHYCEGPIKVSTIAQAQAIPHRFLEVILHQLKQAGFVNAKRGNEGGYYLVRDPKDITMGELLRCVEGPLVPVHCLTDETRNGCPLRDNCVFMPVWERVQGAVHEIYDTTTFRDLALRADEMRREQEINYAI